MKPRHLQSPIGIPGAAACGLRVGVQAIVPVECGGALAEAEVCPDCLDRLEAYSRGQAARAACKHRGNLRPDPQ